jgi:excisionase family DNA binding protein
MVDLWKKLTGELIDIIEWLDDSNNTLVYRFERMNNEIKYGAKLTVREGQMAVFINEGQLADVYKPGMYTLTTQNMPILSTLKGWKYGFESPFKADVYYVTTRLFTGNKWGTANPIMLRDKDFGIVRLRAFGTYDFKIVEPRIFLKEVAGSDFHFHLDEFADTMRSRMVSVFSDAMASSGVPALDMATRYTELGEALLNLINPAIGPKYGLEITSFLVENVSVPPEVEAAIDKRSSMGAIGNLNDYVKFQMAEGLGKGTGGGMGGTAAEMAMGFAMAGQMMNQPGGMLGAQGTPAVAPGVGVAAAGPASAAAAGSAIPDLMGVADAAKLLGVSDADVLATLESGDLKGKKIGSTWRITRKAVDDFLTS